MFNEADPRNPNFEIRVRAAKHEPDMFYVNRCMKIIEEELFFAAYLHDRIIYAHQLGHIDTLPRPQEALLDAGKEISYSDVQKLLGERQKKEQEQVRQQVTPRQTLVYIDTRDKRGKRTRLINPDLPEEERQLYEEEAAEERIRVVDLEEDLVRRGEILESSRAETYPTIRWNFPWDKYTVVGVPDGVTEKFVYEYKTTRSRYLLHFLKSVATAQADLYGYFFQRHKKRVQILVVEENVIETFQEVVDIARAQQTLTSFGQVDRGERPHPPKAWKCGLCDFQATSPISSAK